ncbi:hypothetical protein [Caldicoprobacter algeriensis]|uniref:hypothetical protein n=1 Tax=Caldicoprobacter algeriensis TaxID=699281 RepID=UPI00207A6978|nr:hypothetical protein [Caldicoprobacter algeriensis]
MPLLYPTMQDHYYAKRYFAITRQCIAPTVPNIAAPKLYIAPPMQCLTMPQPHIALPYLYGTLLSQNTTSLDLDYTEFYPTIALPHLTYT